LNFSIKKVRTSFKTEEALAGGCCYDAHGVAITDETWAKAKAADCRDLRFGRRSEMGPTVPYDARPEAGLLRLRKDLDLYANVRPAIVYPALADLIELEALRWWRASISSSCAN